MVIIIFFAYVCTVTRGQTYALLLSMLLITGCGSSRRAPVQPVLPTSQTVVVPPSTSQSSGSGSQSGGVSAQTTQNGQSQTPSATAPDNRKLSERIVEYARTFTGVPYKLGAAGPSMFDCSGFTRYVFREFGYTLTHQSGIQYRECRKIDNYADLQVADLVFFGSRRDIRNISHVGIVVSIDRERGSFSFIHASVSKGVTEESSTHPYFMMRYIGAGRIIPDEDQ